MGLDVYFVKMTSARSGEHLATEPRTMLAFILDPDDISIFVDLRKFLPGILRERLQLRLGVLDASLYR